MISLETIDAPKSNRGRGVNLLRFQPIRSLIHWSGFPYAFQALLLSVFATLAVIGWGRHAPQGVPDKLYAKANLTTLLIWGLWWPVMVWLAVLFGRAWCTVCPLELVASTAERCGRALRIKQRHLGKWLRSGAFVVGLYALIQMLVAGVHLHRVPAYTSLFLWGLLSIAALTGFLWKDRAFCRGFCPVGLLLSIYGRGGMLALRHDSTDDCASCTTKDCIRADHRCRWQGRSCPSLLNPANLNSNRNCLVCCQCVKVCPKDNMRLLLRRPFPLEDKRDPMASWPVVAFVVLVSGFVTGELCSEWPAAQAGFLWLPRQMSGWFGLPSENGWVAGVWMLLAFPLLMWLLLACLACLLGAASTVGKTWRQLALPLAVVIAAGHMAKGLAKFNSWASFLPRAAMNPGGDETAIAIRAGSLTTPSAVLPLWLVALIGLALVAAAGYLALREARLAEPGRARSLRLPILALVVFYAVLVAGWAT